MNVNGINIFLGAYNERLYQNSPTSQPTLSLDKERTEMISREIKKAYYELGLHNKNKGVEVTLSQEAKDFLGDAEACRKLQQESNLWAIQCKSYNESIKEFTADKNPDDPFWYNPGDQWLIFSETLYKNGFYNDMSDSEIKEFEDNLAYITRGMDYFGQSQYPYVGVNFYVSPSNEKWKMFMSSSEIPVELESSVLALRYLSDNFLSKEHQEGFNQLIDKYYQHNKDTFAEYTCPMEIFNKRFAKNYSNTYVSDELAGERKYGFMLGKIEKSEQEKLQYQKDLQVLFKELTNDNMDKNIVWEKIGECFTQYATDNSNDMDFKNYIMNDSQYLFEHMKNCWDKLFKLTKT